MAKFIYKGTTANGTEVSQVVDAADRFAIYDFARTNGHTVSSIEEVPPFSLHRFINVEKANVFLSRVKQDELVMITKNLSSMLKAGLSLSRALSVIERQSTNPRTKFIMKDVQERVSRGDQFNAALKAHPDTFPSLYVAMVRAGEESGGLAPALETIALQLERSSSLRKKVVGAMIYPAIVISVMALIGVLMMIYVMPTITQTFMNMKVTLPITTQILIAASTFFTEHGLLALLIFLTVTISLVLFSRTTRGKYVFHAIFIHLPIIGTLTKETNSAYTARTLSSLFSAGVSVITAIEITEEVLQNVYYKNIMIEAAKRVEKGTQLSSVFMEHENLYPVLVGEMVLVGEETGETSQMLNEIANFYEKEVEQKTKNLSTIVEPLLMVVIGSVVGFFALAVIAPIYSIGNSI